MIKRAEEQIPTQWEAVKNNFASSITKMFPISGRRRVLEIGNIHYDESKADVNDIRSQQLAKDQEKTWGIPVYAEFTLRDKESGEVVNKSRQKIAVMPKMTARDTYILAGGEYNSAFQWRLKSGIYSKIKENGIYETEFNLNGRENMFIKEPKLYIHADPETKGLKLKYGTNVIPLYSFMKCIGTSDDKLKQVWGEDIYKANAKKGWEKDIMKMYTKKWKPRGLVVENDSFEGIQNAVKEALHKAQVLPETTKLTVGKPYKNLSEDAILDGSLHILSVVKGEKKPDDIYSLYFKHLLGLDDFIGEKFGASKTALTIKQKIRNQLDRKDKISSIVSTDIFNKPLGQVFYGNSLSQRPDQTNPLDILASKSITTSMGPGGISSEHQLRPAMKTINQSHFGFLDAIHTPECLKLTAFIQTFHGWKSVKDITEEDLFACIVDNELQFHKAKKIHKYDYKGKLIAFDNKRTRLTVTPNHRIWYAPTHKDAQFRFDFAQKLLDEKKLIKVTTRHPSFLGAPKKEFQFDEFTFDLDDWAELLGWVISEGNCSGTTAVIITQSETANPKKVERIKELLERLPWYWTFYSEKRFRIASRALCSYMRQFGLCDNKYIPEEAFSWPESARRRLMESLLLGDGKLFERKAHWKREVYCTTSPQLAKDFERLAISLGRTCSIRTYKDKREERYKLMYEITMLQQENRQFSWKKGHIKEVGYEGPVYCVTVPGGKILVKDDETSFAVWTGNSEHTGVTLNLPIGVKKEGREAKTLVYSTKDNKFTYKSPSEVHGSWTAIPKEMKWQKGSPIFGDTVTALNPKNHQFEEVAPSKVEYIIPSAKNLFDENTNSIPFLQCNQGNRTMTGSKQPSQGVSLEYREAPLVQVKSNGKDSFEKVFGSMFSHSAPEKGIVHHIEKDDRGNTNEIHIKDEHGNIHKVQTYNNFQLNDKKSFLHATPIVKIGDSVEKGQTIADSNYTQKGELAIGTNLRTAYVSYGGQTYEDSAVLSESAAKKLSSVHLHRPELEIGKGDVVSLNKYLSYAASVGKKVKKDKLSNLDDNGVIKVGSKVNPGDVLVAAVGKNELTGDLASLGNRLKGAILPYRDKSLVWDAEHEGTVERVVKRPGDKGYKVYIKTVEPMKVGDKLAARHGDKNIIGAIIPDSQMPRQGGPDGRPYEFLTNPSGVVSRINLGQLLELSASKIAEKTGQPYITENFKHNISDYSEKLRQEMAHHGLSDKSKVYDPVTKTYLENEVWDGHKYVMKLKHQVEKKESVRGMDQSLARKYSVNEDPSRGGGEGAQAISQLDLYALLAHGARANLKEMSSYKAERQHNSETMADTDFWNRVMLGLPLQPPKPTFAYKKFEGMLTGMGLNLKKEGHDTVLTPLTDKGVKHLSNGEIKESKMLRGKDDSSIKHGLFDDVITGGIKGKNWSHVELADPFPSPLFVGSEKMPGPAVILSGMKYKDFDAVVHAKQTVNVNGKELTGGAALEAIYKNINIKKDIESSLARLKNLKGSALDKENKKVKFLMALDKLKMRPEEAYIMKTFPILPPIFRPITPMADGTMATADINSLYSQLIQDNNALKDKENLKYNPELHQKIQASVYDKLKAAVGIGNVPTYDGNRRLKGLGQTIAGDSPKTGFFQNKIMKRRQDLSMRSTITPAPDLQMDQVGLPKDAALELYKPFVIRELVRAGKDLIEATKDVKEQTPMAWKALDQAIKDRPVLVKRDPVLHKYNIQAYLPVLKEGRSIGLHPLACSAANADFDGDSCLGEIIIVDKVKLSDTIGYNEPNGENNQKMPHLNNSILNFKVLDIAEFPRIPGSEQITTSGAIEYDVPEGTFVPSLDRDTMRILPVTKFSIHPNCEEWVTKTFLGRELITSSCHSLAVLDPETLEVVKSTPREAVYKCAPSMLGLYDQPLYTTFVGKEPKQTANAKPMIKEVPMNREMGWFIGATIGDGWVTVDRGNPVNVAFAYGTLEDGIRTYWCQLAQKLAPESAVSSREMPHEFEGKECSSAKSLVNCSTLASWMAELVGLGAQNKHLPSGFIAMPLEFRMGLFCGLMDTDGTCNWNQNDRFSLAFTTISPYLKNEISVLALSLGLIPSVTTYENRGKPAYCITFSVRTVQNARWLSFAVDYKQEALNRLFSLEEKSFGPYNIVPFPISAQKEVKEILKSLGATKRKENPALYSQYVVVARADGYITRTSIEKLLPMITSCEMSEYLRKWCNIVMNLSIGWDYIESTQPTGETKTMYDITVPGTLNFTMADGLVVWDTMAVYLPLTEDARKEALERMLPSRNLFSSTNYGIMQAPDQEAVVGLHLSSLWGAKKDKTYKSLEDITKDHSLHRTDVVKYQTPQGIKETTPGRARMAVLLPHSFPTAEKDKLLHDAKFELKKGIIHNLLETAARTEPKGHADLVDGWRNLGNDAAYKSGFSFSLNDLKVNKELRDKILQPYHQEAEKIRNSSLAPEKKDEKIIDLYSKATEHLDKELGDYYRSKGNNMQKMVDIKARGKQEQFRQTVIAPMLLRDNTRVIPTPITKSYAEGLSIDQYWNSLYGARMGTLSRAQGTAQPGAMAKEIVNLNIATVINSPDCGATKGQKIPVIAYDGKEERDIVDRHLASDFNHNGISFKAGTLVTPEIFSKIKSSGAPHVEVRSPISCKDSLGICQKCMGLNENGRNHEIGTNIGAIASHAVSEPAVQLAMDCGKGSTVVVIKEGDEIKKITLEELFLQWQAV